MAPTPGPVPGPVGQVASAASEVQEAETSTYLMTPRNSMTVTHTKGLLNMPGQNNCFLNSAVQVLWHLDIFRRSFRDLTGHSCMAESCIFCALKELFTQFQYSQESALPPDALRHALAKTFCDQRRFQLGFMDDAAECFENILLRIHVHIANQESEDMCGDVNCIPHQKFAMTLVEQPMCHTCGATSEPLPFTQMVHYVTTSALCSKALEIQKQGNGCYSQDSFGKLLRLAGDVGDVRDCTSGCGSKTHIKKTLMNHPAIVSIGLVWDSECPSLEHITDVFHNIGMTLQLKDMFHSVVDTDWVTSTSHELVGVVTYYGKHYSTFFFHTKLRVWIYFDDATVREIGPRWEQVVEKCQRGHFQPLLLLFANSNGASVPANSVSRDHPLKEETDRRDSTSVKSTNQRQAVISKYLMFQNMCKNDENGNLRNQSFVTTNQYAPKIYSGDDNNPCHIQQSPHDTHQITVKSQVPVISNSCVHPHNHSLYTYNNCIAGHLHPHSEYCVHHCQNSDYNSIAHPASNCTNAHVSKYSPSSHNYQFHVDPQELSKVNGGILSNLLASKYASLGNQHQQDVHQPVNSDFQCISNTAKPQEQIVAKKESLESSKDSDSAFAEDDSEAQDTYISRKAVENVLNLQKLQRQISLNRSYNHSTVGNRNSSSSLESFDNTHHKLSSLHRDLHSLETENLSCRRDSGSWSGDRNSSSSSSNASVESPFLSVVATKRLLLGPNNFHLPAGKGHLAEYSNVSTSDHGYDSYSVSSSDSYPSVTGSPAKLDPRLTQIPEDWQEDLDKKLQMITVESSGPPDCDKLCAEADLLLAKSHDKEREGDLVMAALLCDSAAARARAAMDAPYNNSRSLVSAKMKHSTCVMRSSCLYRRIKDNEENERRRQKGITGGHSRQSSRDSNHGRHSRQGSKDSTHAKQTSKENSRQTVEESDNFGKNIEIYGTLPKKGSRKKIASSSSVKAKDDQIYKDFLDKQRQNVKLPSGSNDHSQKVSVKSQNKHENPKSKFESISEKQHKKPVAENAVPKSPIQKKQDNQSFLNNEDLEINNAKKWTSSKQLSFDRSCHGLSPPKDVDYISGGEAVNRNLLSPLSPHDKKQHRVKRKLMGGFMKRKNRSLPDLREEQNLSDPMDRSFDDTTVVQIPSTLTLPNGKLKKLDFQSDAHINPVTRGFHQPHHAFVKKDLTHRPLLMKVNPPNIQPSVSSSPKSKPTHILPSLPKKIETKTKSNEISFTRDRPSKIPFMSPFQKADVSLPPVLLPLKPVDSAQSTLLSPLNPMDSAQPTVLLPLNPVDSAQSTVLSPQKTSTPVLNSQMTVLGPNTEMENVASVLSPSHPNEDLPLPSNPFLAELQAKRQQIIGTISQKEKCHKTERENLNLSSELKPNVAKLSVASDGSSWLQELQSKQQQMLHKQNCQSCPLLPFAKDHRDFSLSPTENSCAETFTRVKPKVNCPRIFSQNLKTENEEASSSSLETKLTESSSACNKNTVITSCDNSKARSVKDLASRFEKAFNSHQDINCSSESLKVSIPKAIEKTHNESVLSLKPCSSSPPVRTFSSNMSIDHDLQEKIHLVQYSENKSSENHTSESLSLAHSTHSFSENQKSFKSNTDSQSDSQIIRTSNGSENIAKTDTTVLAEISNPSTQQRPQKPPDYETALQRLELIRTNPATSSAELYQRISDSDCISSSLRDTSAISVLAEPPRKKQGPKKTVTFSDEVVLVSCAEYDDSDFLPNPLLERVYQQHIQAGGSEITQLNISSDSTAFKTDSEYSCSDEKKAETHHTGSHEESQNNNSYGIIPCHLCHNKYITPPSIYCPDCTFYMSRFQP